MANYFLDDDGSLTKKKKKKGNNYILGDNGKVTLDPMDVAPVKKTNNKSSDRKPTMFEELIGSIKDSKKNYELGKLSESMGMESYKMMKGEKNEYDKIKKKYDKYISANPDLVKDANVLDQTIQTLPNQVGALKSGVKGGGLGAGIGSVAGAIIGAGAGTLAGGAGAGPGAVAGATTGAKWIGGAGYVKGSADYTYKLESGLQYQALIEMGVPEDIAKEEAKDTGLVNALIESGESIVDLVTLGGLSAIKTTLVSGLTEKYGTKKVAEWVGESAAKKALKEGGKWVGKNVVKNAVSEGIEEGLQEATSIHNEKQATELAGIERDDSLDLERIKEAIGTGSFAGGITGGGTGVVTGTAKVGINTAQNIIQSNKTQNEQAIGPTKQNLNVKDAVDFNANEQYTVTQQEEMFDKKGFENQQIKRLSLLQDQYVKSQDINEQKAIQAEIDKVQVELDKLNQDTTIQTDEKLLRQQNFTYEVKDTDSDIRKGLYESASKVMNNTTRTHEFVETVAKIAEDKGTKYEFTNAATLKESGYNVEGKQVNGLVRTEKDGKQTVLINIDSPKALQTIVGHETTHLLEGTQEYQDLQEAIFNYAKDRGDYNARLDSLKSLYNGIENANIDSELTADLVGDYLFTDTNFINSLSVEKPTLFQKIKELIDDLVVRFTGTKDEKALREVQKKFKAAYKQTTNNQFTDVIKTEQKAQAEVQQPEKVIAPTKTESKNISGVSKLKAKYDSSTKVKGNKHSIVLNDGEQLTGTYVLTEAGSVTSSHNSNTFAKSENFPVTEQGTTINDRDYEHDKVAQQLVQEKAQIYDGRAFNDNGVIVTRDGIVVSGNDRTMAGEIASRNNTDTAYIEYLKDNAEQFGFTREQIEGIEHPRVVLELDDALEYNTKTFAKFNKDSKKTKSISEKAKEIGKTIDDVTISQLSSVFDKYDSIDQVYNSEKATRDIMDLMLNRGLIDSNEISQVYDGAKFTGAGKDLIEATVIGSVVNEENVKYFRNNNNLKFKIMKTAPAIIQNTTLGDYSITDEFNNAMGVYKAAQQANMTVEQYSNQMDIFGDSDVDVITKRIAEILEKKGYKELKNFVDKYNKLAEDAANGQVNLFTGEIETKEEILNHALTIDEDTAPVTQYSLSQDNQGRTLSKEQQEYFKDSKVRDKNGNLLEVYHGTSADFNVFKQGDGALGEGIYFSESEEYARSWGKNNRLIKSYVNITNPYISHGPSSKSQAQLIEQGYDGVYNPENGFWVAFNSNQIKNIDNTKPTSNPDIRYSLSEEGKMVDNKGNEVKLEAADTGTHGTLMAMHSLTESKMRGVIELKGIPLPSIAIARKVHEGFGDVTVLFDKSTIDPANKANEVYDRDVWSPRVPRTVNKFASNVKSAATNLGLKEYQLKQHLEGNTIEEATERLAREDAVIDKFLEDSNIQVEQVENVYKNKEPKAIYHKIPEIQNFVKENDVTYQKLMEDANLRESYLGVLKDWAREKYKDSPFKSKLVDGLPPYIVSLEEQLNNDATNGYYEGDLYVQSLSEDFNNIKNAEQELDEYATKRAQQKAKDSKVEEHKAEFDNYIREQLETINEGKYFEKEGVDPYTANGRKSFSQLHTKYTLENLVKAMKSKSTVAGEKLGTPGFGEIQAAMAKKFKSIKDIKANENQIIPREQERKIHEIARDTNYNDLLELSKGYKYYNPDADVFDYHNQLGFDNASQSLFDLANSKNITIENFKALLNENLIDSSKIPTNVLQKTIDNLLELRDMPTEYFEAKPQRAVGLDEVQAVIIPNTSSAEFKQLLQDNGLRYYEYDPNIEGDKQRVIDQFDDLRFSLSQQNEAVTKNPNLTYGEDVKLQVEEAIAPLQEQIKALTKQVTNITTDNVKVPENPNMEDLAPVTEVEYTQPTKAELDNLMSLQKTGGTEYANEFFRLRDKYGQPKLYKGINEYNKNVSNSEQVAPVKEEYEAITPEPRMIRVKEPQKLGKVEGRVTEPTIPEPVYGAKQQTMEGFEEDLSSKKITRKQIHADYMNNIKQDFAKKGLDFDKVLDGAVKKSTFSTVDNTPQRVIEKTLGYKEGQILNDLTINKEALNESAGIKWLNSFTNRKTGEIANFVKKYNIKPGSKESAAAQMYGEGFYVNEANELVEYGDAELAKDFPNAKVRENIKALAKDPRIRQIYDETLDSINESRTRNGYPEIPRRNNYFLHFRAMDDTFSKMGLPFNPNDIRAKDLPTDMAAIDTASLRPGQPYFASANQRKGNKTSYDLLGGLEKYLGSAKNQIYHIDDIQVLRALRNYVAERYGQAKGLENLDQLSDEEAESRIKQVYDSHLSTFAKFLNEQANVLAGKTSLIDRGLEGILGRRGITTLNTINSQVAKNMVGFNLSSSLTNFIGAVQGFAKTQNKFDAIKAFTQMSSNKIGSIFGATDGFVENDPTIIRRQGADKFYRTPYEKVSDAGYALMSGVDNLTTEFLVRTKYNELTRKGMGDEQAHIEAGKWAMRILGDRSLGQQPQLYNSKMLGLVTKFQLEVRNQLDSMFYDTIQEANVNTEDIQNGLARNAVKAAKVTSTMTQLAVFQHIFGKAFESMAGYNPAFDIIETLMTALGFDDDEDSEDTALDNIEQAVLGLLEDLPYTSTLTGGRIPISSALPIEQFIKGKDDYGNDKSRWETAFEVAPYYIMPGGYNQLKKTSQGLAMFDEDLPVAGSYTDSGNLRFPIDDTLENRVQAGLFGQWANENARTYFDKNRATLKEKQIQEFVELDMPIREYWDYRDGLKGLKTVEEKFEYVNDLDVTDEQKNIMINNLVNRKEEVDISNYDDYGSYDEFDFAIKNEEKYDFLQENNISYNDYIASDESKEAYNWAYNNPEKYKLSKAVTSDIVKYTQYKSDIYDLKADKDSNGKSINGSRKEKVIRYVNGLNLSIPQKAILLRQEYPSDDTYNNQIVEYVGGLNITYDEKKTILEELDMTVGADGYVYWD